MVICWTVKKMLKRIVKILSGLVLIGAAFIGSVVYRDYSYENFLQANKGRIKSGMTSSEVVAILGEPTSKHMTDGPGAYWCYGSSTLEAWQYGDVYCGSVGFEMTDYDGIVLGRP